MLGGDICSKCNWERISSWNLKINPVERGSGRGEGRERGRKNEHKESCSVFLVIGNES